MKKILSLLLVMLFGATMYAQNVITDDYYYQDFENPTGWNAIGGWDVDEVFTDMGNMAYVDATGNQTYNCELQSPKFRLSSSSGTGSATFYVLCYPKNGGSVSATFNLGVAIDGSVLPAGSFTVSSSDSWVLKTISFANLAPYLSANGSNVQFVISFASATADAYIVLDDFTLRSRGNAFVARLLDPSQNYLGMVVAAADSSITAPAYTGTVPSGQAFAYWAIYDFNGDFLELGAAEGDVITGVDQDMLWLATMGDIFTVSYNANGGTGTMAAQQGVQYLGHTVMANSFTRDGYSFAGWNTKSDGTGTSYAVGDNLGNMDNDYNLVSTSVTLYAQWTQNTGVTYTVSFDANGGSGTMTSATVNSGAAYVLPTATFTAPSGKTFFCWNTMANGTGTSYAAGSSVNVNANMTFYAQWVDDNNGGGQGGGQGGGDNGGGQGGGTTTTYTIHFAANGGTGYMNDATVEAGDYYTIPSCGFTRNGYTFLTWNTMPDGTGSTYSPGIEISIPGNITLYAIWDQNGNGGGDNGGGQGGGDNGGGQGGGTGTNYIVRYNGNGGVGTMTEQTVADNTTITLKSCQFTREGFTFTGWNTAADGTGASYNPGDEVTITSNMTFYAQWRSTNAINSVAMASVSVYPNPATTMVKVNGTNATRIDVLDLAGRTIRTAEGTNTISLNGLANGVYTLRITAAEGMALRKIVKK